MSFQNYLKNFMRINSKKESFKLGFCWLYTYYCTNDQKNFEFPSTILAVIMNCTQTKKNNEHTQTFLRGANFIAISNYCEFKVDSQLVSYQFSWFVEWKIGFESCEICHGSRDSFIVSFIMTQSDQRKHGILFSFDRCITILISDQKYIVVQFPRINQYMI